MAFALEGNAVGTERIGGGSVPGSYACWALALTLDSRSLMDWVRADARMGWLGSFAEGVDIMALRFG
jgi:hypothetical protein